MQEPCEYAWLIADLNQKMCNSVTVHHMDRCIGTLQVHNMHDEPKMWVCAPDFSLREVHNTYDTT